MYSAHSGGRALRLTQISQHPVVRRHPVTGEKALYVNQGFTTRIVGFKDEESEYLLKFLFDHIAKGADFHVRATYKPGTVVVWVRLSAFVPMRKHALMLTPFSGQSSHHALCR